MNKSAKEIYFNALKESSPAKLLEKKATLNGGRLKIGEHSWEIDNRPIYIIAVGKASEDMCEYLSAQFKIDSSNYICIAPDPAVKKRKKKQYFYASHPYPDEKSLKAAQELVQFIKNIPPASLVIFALSGGASSLVCKPANRINLSAVTKINKLLLESGAAIDEINCVRKHLSDVKGGQLLNFFHPGITLIDLVISDVPDDDLESIGSGLTIPDSSTFRDVHHVLLEYNLWEKIPETVRKHFEKGLTGEVFETLKPGENLLQSHFSFVIGSAQKFAETVSQKAKAYGYEPWIAEEYYNDAVEKVSNNIVNQIKRFQDKNDHSRALIYYGESTVDVRGDGKGGRNQQMALEAVLKIAGIRNITWLSAGTDGIDGPTDAAGAIVDGESITKANSKGLDATEFIRNNDSYHFHKQLGTLLKTGPTGNNLMDIVLVLID